MCSRRKINTNSTILIGRTVIVTGSNTGIGKETARFFVSKGARVILACRNIEKANQAAREIETAGPGQVDIYKLDLASFKSIHEFAEQILQVEERIDILVNNAAYWGPKEKTEDGFDLTFSANYLGPFLLTHLLLDRIKECAPARIVNVASRTHKYARVHWKNINLNKPGSYRPWKAYTQSKLCNILFSKELANQLQGTGVNIYCLHPGMINTDLHRNFRGILRVLTKFLLLLTSVSLEEGARTTIYCSVAKEVKSQSGLYYSDCAVAKPSSRARDLIAAKMLWDMSIRMCNLEPRETVQTRM